MEKEYCAVRGSEQALRHHGEQAEEPQEYGAAVWSADRRRSQSHHSQPDRRRGRAFAEVPVHGRIPAETDHSVRGLCRRCRSRTAGTGQDHQGRGHGIRFLWKICNGGWQSGQRLEGISFYLR